MGGGLRALLLCYRTSEGLRWGVLRRTWPGSVPGSIRLSNVSVTVLKRMPAASSIVYHQPLSLITSEEGLRATPVFAVLAGSGRRLFRGCKPELAELLQYARRQGRLMYVVPAHAVRESVWWHGYVRHRGQWRPLLLPRPQAVYNRIPFRNVERQPESQHAKLLLRKLTIPMFNPGYFNKARLYEWLRADGLSRYIPETVTDLNLTALTRLLRRHRSVYCKPAGGSIGQGILRVDATGDGGVRVTHLEGGRSVSETLPTVDEAWAAVLRRRGPGRYVMQAAVQPILWKSRPCDFRVLLQKCGTNWHVTGIGVRVAAPGSITTHVPNGGSIERLEDVLRSAFQNGAQASKERLERTALILAEAIDRHYDGELGEMSMDLALDESGRVWFLEANSKPMKFDEPDIRERSLQGVLSRLEELAISAPATSPRS
ncbi:MAG: YheC/YheD family protein [Thermoflavifilum sp.]|nr:YheC/YheD family protein [Thermoflavifilum sp.]MCL6513456.1 YheC/YheD family protein [Alicyclobacillus sp.]